MPISVVCPCGKQYRVADEAAGRKLKCKQCDALIRVPQPNRKQAQDIVTAVEIVPEVVPAQAIDLALQSKLQRIQEVTQSAASRPGMLRLNRIRYVIAFPKWAAIWHLPLLGFILLMILHWAFIFPALLFVGPVYLYWRRVNFKFIGGCINPGIVLSLDPPRIAVLTNLTKGAGGDWNVIKVLRHPLHRMSTGRPAVGQRVVTISDYNGSSASWPHWSGFDPVMPEIVSTDRAELKRLMDSISSEDWQELDDSLKQVPTPLTEGLYRIYDLASLPQYVAKPASQVAHIVRNALASSAYTQFATSGIEPSMLHNAASYIAPADLPNVLTICASLNTSKGNEGFAITPTCLYFNYRKIGKGQIPFSQLVGAFAHWSGVEITLRNGTRVTFPDSDLMNQTKLGIEMFAAGILETD